MQSFLLVSLDLQANSTILKMEQTINSMQREMHALQVQRDEKEALHQQQRIKADLLENKVDTLTSSIARSKHALQG
jgi:hypothetical protein